MPASSIDLDQSICALIPIIPTILPITAQICGSSATRSKSQRKDAKSQSFLRKICRLITEITLFPQISAGKYL